MDVVQTLPKEVEIIIILTVREVMGHRAYVMLDEYNNMSGLIHISEIATGWIRNIERYIRPKQKAVLKVIKIIKSRGEVDTSLKQVSAEERKLKIIEAEKNDKAVAFLDLSNPNSLKEEEAQDVEEKILQKYSGVYDAFEAVSRNGLDAISGIGLPQQKKDAIQEASKRIPVSQAQIGGIMEITSKNQMALRSSKILLRTCRAAMEVWLAP